MRAASAQSSLPGLTPQVGFTRLAAHYAAQLGRARVAVQSILFAKKVLTKRMDPRVKPPGDGGFAARAAPHTEPGARPRCASAQTNMLYAEERDPSAAADFPARNGPTRLVGAYGQAPGSAT